MNDETMMQERLVERVSEMLRVVLERNISVIAHEFAQAEDGTMGLGLRVKLSRVKQDGRTHVAMTCALGFARKWKDECEDGFTVADPNQPELPGATDGEEDGDTKVTMVVPGMEPVTTTMENFKRLGKKVREMKEVSDES